MSTSDEVETQRLTATEERDQLFAAIGHIIVNFQLVELWLAEALTEMLSLKVLEDRYIISSAMSFRQKVDLIAELYPRKKTHVYGVEIKLIKRALHTAEEFRNRIVHSVWTVEPSRKSKKWVRIKSNIKGKNGFIQVALEANIAHLEAAAKALHTIRDWELSNTENLESAISILSTPNTDVQHRIGRA